jgi:hypothetical protein
MERDVSQLDDASLRKLHTWWIQISAGGRLPGKRDFDPAMHADLLPRLFICDVLDANGRQFIYRLTGTDLEQYFHIYATGQELRSVPFGKSTNMIWEHYNQVAEKRRPSCHELEYVTRTQRHVHYRRLLLPLSATQERVDWLLGAVSILRAWSE